MTIYAHDVCKNCGQNDFEVVGHTFDTLSVLSKDILQCINCSTNHLIDALGVLTTYIGEIFPFSDRDIDSEEKKKRR